MLRLPSPPASSPAPLPKSKSKIQNPTPSSHEDLLPMQRNCLTYRATMTAQIAQLIHHPPSSIMVSRSEALRYIESCELAEMTPSSNSTNFLNQLLSSSSSSNAGNDGSESKDGSSGGDSAVNKYASIIQMAFLLYLGEYVHARHLWRRQRTNNNSISSSDDDYNQLSMFWTAAKYCYLWNTGGVSSSLNSTAGDENEESSNLPYSTLMLRSLQSNAESSLEPLATYSKELVSIFRYRVNDRLHSTFDDIREDEFMLRMNLLNNSDDGAEEDDVLGRYGWKRAGADATHLVPNQEWKSPVDMGRGEDGMISTDDDRIHQLSEVVMFLEQTKMNA